MTFEDTLAEIKARQYIIVFCAQDVPQGKKETYTTLMSDPIFDDITDARHKIAMLQMGGMVLINREFLVIRIT